MFRTKSHKKHEEFQGLTVSRVKGIYWIKERKTGRIVSWCLNQPDSECLKVLSRAVGWQFNTKGTNEEMGFYKGIKPDAE